MPWILRWGAKLVHRADRSSQLRSIRFSEYGGTLQLSAVNRNCIDFRYPVSPSLAPIRPRHTGDWLGVLDREAYSRKWARASVRVSFNVQISMDRGVDSCNAAKQASDYVEGVEKARRYTRLDFRYRQPAQILRHLHTFWINERVVY